ncbi:MAG TPA: HAMP domain-containing sensor histidine kinase [Mucilaginibacter sp.]|nr:HAMP domain-containing sensor histidine kinase [Mucilaginibacter sp.]
MKKHFFIPALFALIINMAYGQTHDVDSLQKAYNKTRQDTTLAQLYFIKSASIFLTTNVDSGMIYARKCLALSRKIHYKKGEVRGLAMVATFQNINGDLPGALKTTFEALPEALKIHEMRTVASCYNTRGLTYSTMNEQQKALDNYYCALHIVESNHFSDFEVIILNNIARAYMDMNRLDSSAYFATKVYNFAVKNNMKGNFGYLIRNFGIIEYKKGHPEKAIGYYKKSLADSSAKGNHYLQSEDYRRMAEAWQQLKKSDSCIYYAQKAYIQAKLDHDPDQVQQTTTLLTKEYKARNDFKNAFYYQEVTLQFRDSLFSRQKTLQLQNLEYNEQQRREQAKAEELAYQNKVRFYSLLGVIGVFVLIALILLFANRQRKKANTLLRNQNEQIEKQRKDLEKTLGDLKIAQKQLIQSEKMASLGELTAGIAHEIQNPLNFVNNFSDVNQEMLEELKAESLKPKAERDEQLETELINDLIENEQKINHHGKRADSIVKGMLQHSRASSGQKEPTDLNALADEYFRLAYHGLRAKDKNFNAELVTHFDKKFPKVNMVPQDIGRVLLNLFNNAFYAVNERAKTAGPDYKPTVEVSTAQQNGSVIISVKDNGPGIPETIKDKIMQPFFTTKPTGEGTGLGLSLSYDIVVKGHGGKIEVDSKKDEGSEFIVQFPITTNG